MDLATAVGRLEAAGTEQNRAIFRRHGAHDPLYGVSFAVLDKIAKETGRDQALAEGLWATGNYDARLLACKVADPAVMREAELDAWLCVIAIGVRNEQLRAAAEAVAGRIGMVVVDHGQTGCKTPAAIPYIERTWDRKLARAAKAARAGA